MRCSLKASGNYCEERYFGDAVGDWLTEADEQANDDLKHGGFREQH